MEEGIITDGDTQFAGVNDLLPAGELAAGEVAAARNMRFRYGKAEPRLAFFKVPWSNLVTSGASSVPVPFGTIYGRGYFQDASSVLWAIVAADGKVFKFRDGNGASEVPLPSGITITSTVSFAQTYNGLVMFRGLGNATLIMSDIGDGFRVATQEANTVSGVLTENPTDGDADIPEADRGEWFDARLYVPTETATEKDLVNISDFLNATKFASVRSQARINQGSNDRLIRVIKFGKEHAAVCFKTKSVYALYGTTGALSEMRQDEITRQFGLIGPRACINVGKDAADQPDEVWFMGQTGHIYRITPDAGTGLLGVASLPATHEISGIIARINRAVAQDTVTFELFDDRLYVAVPLDDATSLSPELVRSKTYDGGGIYNFPVIPGATYEWSPGANDYNVANGSTTYTTPAEFVASGIYVQMNGVDSGAVTASLKRKFKNVNNAVLVFDFLRGKWAGYDEATGLMVFEWLKLPIDGEEKLMFLSEDGFVNYHEALFDDEVAYESLGNVQGLVGLYGGTGSTSLSTVAGRRYAYICGANETRLENGTSTLAIGSGTVGTFVAETTSVVAYGTAGTAIGFGIILLDYTLEYAGVQAFLRTRGYRCGSLARKRFPWVRLNVRTFDPTWSLDAVLDGVNETFAVASARTKDNARYLKPANAARWVNTNQNNDHGNPFRQDYHVELSDATSTGSDIVAGQTYYVDSSDAYTAASITYNAVTYNRGETFVGVAGQTSWTTASGSPVVYPPGSYILPGEDGVVLDLHQETEEDFRVARKGRDIQFELTNTHGRCELVALGVQAVEIEQRKISVKE